MRRMMLITALVLALSMAVCLFSMHGVAHVARAAERLRVEAAAAMDRGDAQAAGEALAALTDYLEGHQAWLEMLMEHDELHEIRNDLFEARMGLEFGVADDFYQYLARVGEGLKHIEDMEKLTLSNLW